MVKREGKIEKEIVWLLAAGVTAYFVYRWYKKSQDGKTLTDSFNNAAGRPNQIKPIEAVIKSQADLSRFISSAKSKGIQVPEQRLMQTFNIYNEALKNGRKMPPKTIETPNVQGKWTFGIWFRWPPGIKIKYEF